MFSADSGYDSSGAPKRKVMRLGNPTASRIRFAAIKTFPIKL